MSLADLLTSSVTVRRKGPTRDASGGQVENFADVAGLTGLPASVQQTRGRAQRTLGQRQVFVTHHVYVDQPYDIRRGDVLVTAAGRTLLVHGFEDMGGRGVAFRAECAEET